MRALRILFVFSCLLALTACKQPLAIEGDGDIIELNKGERGCALEEFRAGWARCTNNEVSGTESLRYRALPRPGWTFSHWKGACSKDSPGQDCEKNYEKKWIDWWEVNYPNEEIKALTAVFVPSTGTLTAATYIVSRFGASGNFGFADLLDAVFNADGSYRFTALQASSRGSFDRTPASFQRQQSSLLLTGPNSSALTPSGGATAAGDFLTLVDTDSSDGDISVSYLMSQQTGASQSTFNGTYFCGHILSNGQSLFFRAGMDGKGRGSLVILSDRAGRGGQAGISYTVDDDGTTIFDYAGARLAGSLSADGSMFTATQISSNLQGAGICLRTSGDKMVANVAGSFYGAWMSTQPVAGVTELLLDTRGQTAEAVLVDSVGGRDYSLGQNFMLVKGSGQIETRDADGAVSPDGRVMFIVQTDPNKFPTLIVYVRKT